MKYFFKLIKIYILQFLMRILRFIPIKKNRIVFMSYLGEQYSCNPKYISEYLENQFPDKFEIVWMMNNPDHYQFLKSRGIKVVNNQFLNKIFYELTAKVSILNAGNRYSWIPPRKNQIHINTWHGGGYYKLCGLSEKRKEPLLKRQWILSSKNTTYFVSTNQCFTDNEIRIDIGFKGEVLNIGFPRNDIFFRGDYTSFYKKVCSYFKINEESKILMYAPTYRYKDSKQFILPDFEKLKKIVAKRFGGEWVVLLRMHHMSEVSCQNESIVNVNYRPGAPDMQELLAACDMLISDYSSCIWDYSFTYRPCFLFTPDLDEYTANRGFGIDIYDWGFPVCKTEQELWDAIENYDPVVFRKAMERHHDNLGSFEHGNATEIMGKLIYDYCFPEQTSNA